MIKKHEELLTKQELANILKVSVRTVDLYVNDGMPKFSKKPIRFLESDCIEWIRQRS